MGTRQTLALFDAAAELAVENERQQARRDVAARVSPLSPWAKSDHLFHVDWDDAGPFGGREKGPVSEGEARRVAPVKKGHALLASVLTPAPLVALRNTAGVDTKLAGKDAPTWLYRSDTDIPPETRMAGILSDHVYHEASLLVVRRGSVAKGEETGDILDAVHVPWDSWEVDPDDGTILVNDRAAAEDAVIYIPGPSQGLLIEARDEIREWLSMRRNIGQRLGVPTPSIILEDSDDGDVDDDEIDKWVAKIAKARRSPDGGVMYVPKGIKATAVSANDDAGLFIEARNALRIDIANHLNLPVALLDGSPATASLTYSTGEGKRSEFDDLTLNYWTTPITARLSQDDVVPRGTRIRFDFTDRYAPTNTPTGAVTQD